MNRELLAQTIYEAKKKDAWGNWKSQYREAWPKTKKELRTRLHVGDCDLEFAFAQADAVLELLNTCSPWQTITDPPEEE